MAQSDLVGFSSLNSTDPSGQKEGIWITYFPDSVLNSIGLYHGGTLDGTYVSFYPDGRMQTYTTFFKGKRQGLSRSYNAMDSSIRVSEYRQDTVIHVNVFDGRGHLVLEEFYKDGNMTKDLYYTPEGVIEGRPASR